MTDQLFYGNGGVAVVVRSCCWCDQLPHKYSTLRVGAGGYLYGGVEFPLRKNQQKHNLYKIQSLTHTQAIEKQQQQTFLLALSQPQNNAGLIRNKKNSKTQYQ